MKNTKIEWAHHTFNPWIGCTKVSPGCANCYAETLMDHRWGKVQWGKGKERKRTSEDYWRQPFKWERRCRALGVRDRVFCASLADVLDHEVPLDWLSDLVHLIAACSSLDWLFLTKRPEAFAVRMNEAPRTPHGIIQRWLDGTPPPNVWMGTSVETQEYANLRIPLLKEIPAVIRFLSVEPMLERIDLGDLTGIHWVIVGGESGPGARPMELDWAAAISNQCREQGVSFFMKQLGSVAADQYRLMDKKGGDIREWGPWHPEINRRATPTTP